MGFQVFFPVARIMFCALLLFMGGRVHYSVLTAGLPTWNIQLRGRKFCGQSKHARLSARTAKLNLETHGWALVSGAARLVPFLFPSLRSRLAHACSRCVAHRNLHTCLAFVASRRAAPFPWERASCVASRCVEERDAGVATLGLMRRRTRPVAIRARGNRGDA